MRKRVLLTGATGFVGLQILAALLKADVDILLVVREGSESQLPEIGSTAIIRTPDLFSESPEWWADTCQGVDIFIHAAWYAEPGKYLQSPLNLVCLNGTILMAMGCAFAGVQRFVGIGTCFEYELLPRPLDISVALRPLTPYAGAKAATYLALQHWLPLSGIEFAWCRVFYLYGANEDSRRLVPYIRQQLEAGQPVELTSGDQIRDFMDVCQAGQAIADTALGEKQGAINICSGIATTVRQLAESIADEYGGRSLLKFGARPDNLVDPPFVVGVV